MTPAISSSQSRPVESGRATDDGRAFRRCLGQYATGVAVVTTRHADQHVGMAVNSFAAVSLDPPLVLWSIRCESRSAAAFLEASHFAINVLAADQVEVSQRFGASHAERFSLSAWSEGAGGALLLQGAIAHLECRRHAVFDGGDHHILVGEVERYARFEGQPLVFAQGQYAVARNHPGLQASEAEAVQPQAPGARGELSFLRLLSSVNQRLSAEFDAHRQASGVTVASGRVLSRLYEAPLTVASIEQATYLSQQAAEDALRELLASGLVMRAPSDGFALTEAGRAKREGLARRAEAFTEDKLAGLDAADVAAARRVMTALFGR